MPARQASALFDSVGEGAPVGLGLVDTELRFVRINAALAAINGRPAEEHIGRRIEEMLPELADVLVPIYRQVLETGEPVLEREISRGASAGGHVRHVLASWFPVQFEEEVVGVGAVVVDITARREAEQRLQGVLEQLPVGVVIADAEGRILLGNRQLGDMGLGWVAGSGSQVEETEFVGWRDDSSRYATRDLPLVRSLRTGAVVRGEEVTYIRPDGERRVIEANSAPIFDAGEIIAAVVVLQDVTERRLASERQELIVQAGEVLDSALSVDERLDRFARVLVPRLADYVRIELLENSGGHRPAAIAHQDPEQEALMRAEAVVESARAEIVVPLRARGRVLGALSLTMAESGRRYSEAEFELARELGLRAGLAVDNARLFEEAQALAAAEQRRVAQLDALAGASLAIHRARRPERRVQLIAQSARELLSGRRAVVTIGPGQPDESSAVAEAAVEPGPESTLSAPLIARDGSAFGLIEVTGEFTAADELALEDLARIASLAIENVRLEERERRIARTLQASLLPPRLPAVAGIEAAARFVPGGEGTLVGGDVYDLFPVGDESAFMVADVCGKGAEAAALTAMVRYTLRAEAAHRSRPRDVLGLVNQAILDQTEAGSFSTVLHGRLRVTEGGAHVTLACAGHPPPVVLRAGGGIEAVPCQGALLGVLTTVDHRDVELDLRPGDALVCFTDGVTEGRGPRGMFSEAALDEALAAAAGRTAEAIAEHIMHAALDFQGGRTKDDLALLVLRVPRT